MKKLALAVASWLVILGAAAPFWGCGQTFQVTLTRDGTTAITGSVQLEGAKRTFQGTADAEGNISWDIEGCSGSAKVAPNSQVIVSCSDPLLMQWPDCWQLASATWSAPDLGLSGSIIVEPAGAFYIDPIHGPLVTDAGYSAWLLNMDIPAIDTTTLILELTFATPGCQVDGICLKGLDVALVEPIHPPGQPRQLVPTEGLGLDFTTLQPGDPHVFCIEEETAVEKATWGKVKSLFR